MIPFENNNVFIKSDYKHKLYNTYQKDTILGC